LLLGEIDGTVLFAGHPDLQPVYLEPIEYPILAQFSETLSLRVRVSVEATGRVGRVELVDGNPLALAAVEKAVSQWRFQAFSGAQRSFDLQCDFQLAAKDLPVADFSYQSETVLEPLHLLVVVNPTTPLIIQNWVAASSR
jgi:hypothetical protein